MKTLIFIIKFLLHLNNNLSSAHTCSHCPKEWISYAHNCYYIGAEKKTWNDSVESCVSKNSNLLHIDSEEEQVRAGMCQSLLNLSSYRCDMCWVHSYSYKFHIFTTVYGTSLFYFAMFYYICVLVVNIYFQIYFFILWKSLLCKWI